MSTLATDLRTKLERTCIAARNLAERAAADALKALAVAHHEPYGHMSPEQRTLRNKLRARARQLGDTQETRGQLSVAHIAQECGYEHWHRMLFARFLAENHLLIEPDMGVAVSLEEVKELAKDAKTNLWALAGRYAQTMLPEIFRADDPVLQVPLAREDQLKLEAMLDALAKETFTASDSLGWCYQFWQTERKKEVNESEVKIGADELPSVTQLFTEDYMVDFLLDNTLGAWHAGKVLAANPMLAESAKSEDELRRAVALPGCAWKYLRFIKGKDGKWTPAAGTFDGWPKTAKEIKCLDPCMGSGHFEVAMFERMVALRMAEEKLAEAAAVTAVIRDNLFGLEIDPRCTQIGAFNLALAAWRRVGYCQLPAMNLACSGLAPNTREADWVKIAGDDGYAKNGMARLYRLFKNAPILGSLINPSVAHDELLEADFGKLQPLLERALAQEANDDNAHEMAVTARGLVKAAEILAGQFTLVATNVPYLGRRNQGEALADFSEKYAYDARHDLATVFLQRSLDFCAPDCTVALVEPQGWLFLGAYEDFRERMLRTTSWNCVARLGTGAFETISGEVVNVALICISRRMLSPENRICGLDASSASKPSEKASAIQSVETHITLQNEQLNNPDHRFILTEGSKLPLLGKYAFATQGLMPADRSRFVRLFWENPIAPTKWKFLQGSIEDTALVAGKHQLMDFPTFEEEVDSIGGRLQGMKAWNHYGVGIAPMSRLPATVYTGEPFDGNVHVLIPTHSQIFPAIWAFCSSASFVQEIRKVDQKLGVTCATVVKVPFDLEHWQKVAAKKYPNGLPKPYSSDPTQWLFNGHPKDSDHPLHVAVARLLGYQWPRQTGSSFPDCPALKEDGLEKFADDDGIVCIPSVRGEEPAAERLRKLLATVYGKDWKAQTEQELIRASGSDAADLEEWLRNDFFEQHCDMFHQRPFIWHVWDGRKRDGFHALVNYHKLAGEKGKGRRTLENLTHSYLGDWITRQKHGVDPKHPEEGADERLAAALALKETLEAIHDGEPPYDIFVRWKPLSQQAVGWNPDINDGVRMNIRPFLANDIPGGKKSAGILRTKPNIKWDKDRGKEPKRDKAEYPWFYSGSTYGDRVNDVHLKKAEKS